MRGNSKAVDSNQEGVHPDLEDVVRRHVATPYERPYHEFSLKTFAEISAALENHGGPLILDSGCGTGDSTLLAARRHPKSFVVGIDQSPKQIGKAENRLDAALDNLIIVRADVVDIWRLAVAAGWRVQHHFVLYPNPWPKKQHLKRRWHGHPVFPFLLKLEGRLQLRSNWRIYVDEFAQAIAIATGKHCEKSTLENPQGETAFEKKYVASGLTLFRLDVALQACFEPKQAG